MKKIILKDREGYGPKVTALLDAEECWEIVNGTETEPSQVPPIGAADNALTLLN